jgi:8-oxo-dGTP diphosphatase
MPSIGVFAAIFDQYNRILLVKIKYGSRNWTLPGGHLEANESPVDGVKREVLEETGYNVDVSHLITIYSAPIKDELVLLFRANITGQQNWTTNDEIEEISFFPREQLPHQLHAWNRKRINDAYQNLRSNLCIFE